MDKKITFEEGINELEKIVSDLESGTISLEASFDAYQKGIELYKQLDAILKEGDSRIMELTKDGERDLTEDGNNAHA